MTSQTDTLLAELEREHIPHETEIRMSQHTTFRVGGTAAVAAYPENSEQLVRCITLCREAGVLCALVGGASNLLWDDEPFSGCVIFTNGMQCVTMRRVTMQRVTRNEIVLDAEAGARLGSVSVFARDAALAGLAFAYGIPGSVGGAVYMNAGAYGGEIGDVIASVTCYDIARTQIVTWDKEQCAFGYRTSAFQRGTHNMVILSARFSLVPGDADAIRAEMDDYLSRRREKQPLSLPSAGSAFKRYPGYYTAKLIDEAGLRGFGIGGAQVSEKHAGFLVNRGGATAHDIEALLSEIERRIYEKNGIRIEREIRTTRDCILPLSQ